MAVAYAFSSYAGTNIFVANTPRVNGNYLADLQNQFKKGINTAYLAFSFKVNKTNNSVAKSTSPNTDNTNNVKNTAMSGYVLKPETIPVNLFKSVSKGVSAYEKTDNEGEGVILKIEKGTAYKVRKIEFNGKQYEIIDLTGQ